MTIDSSTNIGGAGPIRPTGAPAEAASPAIDAVRAISLSVVSRIAAEFGLGDAARPPAGGDIYGLRVLSDGIASQLPASGSTSLGALQRAVEAFAGAVAEDVAALADGFTLERVDRILGDLPQPGLQDLGSVTAFLEQAAARLGGGF